MASLTTMRVGQVWLDHTGHNSDRQHRSSTKAWRFDSVGLMTPLSESERDPQEVAFKLSFEHPGKARRRTPDNWADFETRTIRLKDDHWTSEPVKSPMAIRKLSPMAHQFHRALMDALAISDTRGRTTRAAWYAEAVRGGLAQPLVPGEDYKAKDAKQAGFRKYLIEIKTAGLIGVDDQTIFDLRKGS